jgi:hypothetical protein
VRTIHQRSRLAIWWPDGCGDGWLSIEAAALRAPMGVEVACDGQVIGRWRVPPGSYQEQRFPLTGLSGGLHLIELRCERAERAPEPLLDEREPQRYSLRVSRVRVAQGTPLPGP